MSSGPAIVVYASAEALAIAAAKRLTGLVAETERRPFFLALAGGTTPRRLYELLAADPLRARIAWDRLELFFADERAVPPDHPDSNFAMVAHVLLAHVPVKAHRMPAEAGDAAAYARLLATRILARRDGVPVLDLVLLGVGADGHTASLFPGTAALEETRRWVVMNEVPRLATRRMTFTYPLINAARHVWVLATGDAKRDIVARCLRTCAPARGEGSRTAVGDPDGIAPGTLGGADLGKVGNAGLWRRWPIVGVRPRQGHLVWWLDEAAAGAAFTPATGGTGAPT
jgi:6-phosphogluconolactonase